MPRYVILEHDHPFVHWDLMLEAGEVLRTWRLLEPPALGRTVPAEPLPDHRRLYLDYEGAISGGRGTVKRWDAGEYTGELSADGSAAVELAGGRLCGRAVLWRSDGGWRLSLGALESAL